jgi:hypothetical protein
MGNKPACCVQKMASLDQVSCVHVLYGFTFDFVANYLCDAGVHGITVQFELHVVE